MDEFKSIFRSPNKSSNEVNQDIVGWTSKFSSRQADILSTFFETFAKEQTKEKESFNLLCGIAELVSYRNSMYVSVAKVVEDSIPFLLQNTLKEFQSLAKAKKYLDILLKVT